MREAVPVVSGQVDRSTPVEGSFEECVAVRSQALWRSAWLLTGDPHRAEDLVQTTLMKCWRRWDRIGERAAEAYVRRAMATTYTDWWRRRWNGETPTAELPEAPVAGDDPALRRDVLAALARLPRGRESLVSATLCSYDDDRQVLTPEQVSLLDEAWSRPEEVPVTWWTEDSTCAEQEQFGSIGATTDRGDLVRIDIGCDYLVWNAWDSREDAAIPITLDDLGIDLTGP